MVYYKLRFSKVMILYFIFYFVLDITKTNMNIRTNRIIEKIRMFLIVQYCLRNVDLKLEKSGYFS